MAEPSFGANDMSGASPLASVNSLEPQSVVQARAGICRVRAIANASLRSYGCAGRSLYRCEIVSEEAPQRLVEHAFRELATMSAVAFDTLKFAEKLESGGFTPQQAKAAAQAFAEASADQLATKTDISVLRTDIEALRLATKSDIETLRLATKSDLAEMKSEILKWMFGTIGFQTIVILGAVLALSRFGH